MDEGIRRGMGGEDESANDKKTKRARSQVPRHSQHHPKLPPPKPSLIKPLHPRPPRTLPLFQPTTPGQRRKSAHRRKNDVRAHTTEARKREMWDRSDGIGFQERGGGEGGGVIEFLMKDEWWWIDVMARNPTARHRKGASAVESQCSYSYSIQVVSCSSTHTVPSNTALLIPLPPRRHHKVPSQQNGERPTPCVVEACSKRTGRLCLGGTDTVEWGKGEGGRAGGGWWVVGVCTEMGVVRIVVGRRK